jgi:hypothetical protein
MTISSDLSGSTQLADGITAQPAEVTTPDSSDDHDGGGGSLFGALGAIAKGATSAIGGAINGIGDCTTGAFAVAAGTTGAVAKFQPQLLGAISDMDRFVSSLNGIQKSFPGNDLTKGALDTFTGAQSLGRQSLNWMKSTENMVKNFGSLSTGVQDQVKKRCGDFAKAGGVLAQAKTAMEAFKEFPWEEAQAPTEAPSEIAEPSATNDPTSVQNTQGTATGEISTNVESSTQMSSTTQGPSYTTISSQTTSSSSGTPTPTADAVQTYGICSKRGTSLETFKNFIEGLDGGKGPFWHWDTIGKQMYLADINATTAKNISQVHDFVDWIGIQTFSKEDEDQGEGAIHEEYRAINTLRQGDSEETNLTESFDYIHHSSPHLVPRVVGPADNSAPAWKKMLSAPPQPPNSNVDPVDPSIYPGYQADDSGGRGTTIYVLDDGFDLSHPVCV